MKNGESLARSILTNRGLKVTLFRLHLVDLLSRASGPLSAVQIQERFSKDRFKDFDRATLFRNLKAMEESGLLEATEFGQGAHYYSLTQERSRHEHHVFCIKCERTDPIEVCGAKISINRAQQKGYKNLRHRLELLGICPGCA